MPSLTCRSLTFSRNYPSQGNLIYWRMSIRTVLALVVMLLLTSCTAFRGKDLPSCLVTHEKSTEACLKCHLEESTRFRLPYHHPVPEGRMNCTDCHRPMETERFATFLKTRDEHCFQCHPEKRGPFVWEHEALREGCTVCHEPHGSINEKLLVEKGSILCLKCHLEVGFPTIGGQSHGGYFKYQKALCLDCHHYVHGSNLSRDFRRF